MIDKKAKTQSISPASSIGEGMMAHYIKGKACLADPRAAVLLHAPKRFAHENY